jgi:hypothetical protein
LEETRETLLLKYSGGCSGFGVGDYLSLPGLAYVLLFTLGEVVEGTCLGEPAPLGFQVNLPEGLLFENLVLD